MAPFFNLVSVLLLMCWVSETKSVLMCSLNPQIRSSMITVLRYNYTYKKMYVPFYFKGLMSRRNVYTQDKKHFHCLELSLCFSVVDPSLPLISGSHCVCFHCRGACILQNFLSVRDTCVHGFFCSI